MGLEVGAAHAASWRLYCTCVLTGSYFHPPRSSAGMNFRNFCKSCRSHLWHYWTKGWILLDMNWHETWIAVEHKTENAAGRKAICLIITTKVFDAAWKDCLLKSLTNWRGFELKPLAFALYLYNKINCIFLKQNCSVSIPINVTVVALSSPTAKGWMGLASHCPIPSASHCISW